MESKMTVAFQEMQGGLFSPVQKADVGDVTATLGDAGVTLMCWADPFSPGATIPEHVKEATIEAIRSGVGGHYTAPIGNRELKEELAKKLRTFNHLEVEPQRNILITPGSDSGLYFAMLPFISSGDEVMIIDPSYPNNFQNTRIMGGVAVHVPVNVENGYQFEIEEFEKRVSEKTKMIVLTNPNNPTTTVYRREKLEQLAEFAQRHDLVVVVDQAFEDSVYDNIEMVTFAALPGMWERTITVFSFSKGMGLSGYRVGYIVACDKIMDKFYAAAVSVLGATNSAAQIGAIAALRSPEFCEQFNQWHRERRDLVYELCGDIPGVHMMKPESGFLAWLDVSRLGTAEEMVQYLIDEAKVVVNTGTPYGKNGEGHLRIVYSAIAQIDEFKDALNRIRSALLTRAEQLGINGRSVCLNYEGGER